MCKVYWKDIQLKDFLLLFRWRKGIVKAKGKRCNNESASTPKDPISYDEYAEYDEYEA
jgi:hypothetical protein